MVSVVSIGPEKKPAQASVEEAAENPSGRFCLIKKHDPSGKTIPAILWKAGLFQSQSGTDGVSSAPA
jgi:hypothetical protein